MRDHDIVQVIHVVSGSQLSIVNAEREERSEAHHKREGPK